MSSTSMYIFTLVSCLFITSITSKSLLPSYWSKEVVMKRKSVEKACVPFCKVFSSVCNYGECRQKLETDCEWYCECPPDCVGRFCEKLIKAEDSVTTSNPSEPSGSSTIPNITLVKETTNVQPIVENISGNASKVAELSICPPELIDARLNGTNDKVLTSGNMNNDTESAKYHSNDEMNKNTLVPQSNITKSHIVSDTTPAQSAYNNTTQQSLPTDAKMQSGTTIRPVSANEHMPERNSTSSGFTSPEQASTEKSTRHTNEVTSDEKLRTETSTLISLLTNSVDLRSLNITETSSKRVTSTEKLIATPTQVTNSIMHESSASFNGTSVTTVGLPITITTVGLPIIPKTVTVIKTEQKQVLSDDNFIQNDQNASSNATSRSTDDRDAVTISVANFIGNVSNGGIKLEEHTMQADRIKQLKEISTERISSSFISTRMPDRLSVTNFTTGQKASDQTIDKSSINLSISQETTSGKKDEINASNIETLTTKLNLTVKTSEYSSTHSMKILHNDVSSTSAPLNTLEKVIDQPISNWGKSSVEIKVAPGKNKIDAGESMEVQNNFDSSSFKMMSSTFRPATSKNDKMNKSIIETTSINTIDDAMTRTYLMSTVDLKLKSIGNFKNLNVAMGHKIDNDIKVRSKFIMPESNSLAQSKTYESQEQLETGKDSTFP